MSSRGRAALDVVATVVMIAAAVTVMVRSSTPIAMPQRSIELPLELPAEPVLMTGPRKGATAGPVLIVYADLQCPFCAQFARTTLKEVEDSYITSGRVQLLLQHFPLETIHPQALPAAIASTCAGEQERFWEMHDLILEHQQELSPGNLRRHASELLVDLDQYDECVSAERTNATVRRQADLGKTLGVRATPTLVLGFAEADGRMTLTKALSGSIDVDALKAEIDGLIEQSRR